LALLLGMGKRARQGDVLNKLHEVEQIIEGGFKSVYDVTL